MTRTNQDPQLSVEKPSHLVSSITEAISQFTEADVAKMTSDLSQVTKNQIEQIAHPVELHFDCDDLERVSQVRRSHVSAPSDDDDDGMVLIFSVEVTITFSRKMSLQTMSSHLDFRKNTPLSQKTLQTLEMKV